MSLPPAPRAAAGAPDSARPATTDATGHTANNFDFLRFLAACAVLFSHCYALTAQDGELMVSWTRGAYSFGGLAVRVFFVISGFLVVASWRRDPRPVPFALARALRIFPALAVALAYCVLIGLLTTTLPKAQFLARPETWHFFWNNLTLRTEFDLPGVFHANPHRDAVNGSLWSLYYEFRAYLVVLGIGALGLMRRRAIALIAWLGAAALILLYGPTWGIEQERDWPIVNACACFVGGALFALYPHAARWRGLGLLALASAVAFPFLLGGGYADFAMDPLLICGTLWLAHRRIAHVQRFGKFGDFSYGMFIYAFPTQQFLIWCGASSHNAWVLFALAFPATLLLAALSWHGIERPCRDLARHFRKLPEIRPLRFANGPFGLRATHAMVLTGIVLAFVGAVAWHIKLPGLYMDAVNPDYLAVDVLHGVHPGAPIWPLPGNLVFGRIPLLTSFYHGTLNVWLALPFVALFGPSVAALRFAQASAGVAILVLMFFLLRERHARWPWLAGLAVLALALDPVFVYAFRTQLYIQLCPVALLLAAILAGARAFHPASAKNLWFWLAGLFCGLSLFGYFIFAFFVPALAGALFVACRRHGTPPARVFLRAGFGLAIGLSGYALGYCAIAYAQGGVKGFLAFFSQYQHSVGAFQTHRSLADTVSYFAYLIQWVFDNEWQHALMFEEHTPDPFPVLKLSLLLALPLWLWILCEWRGLRSWRLRLGIALILSYPLVALLFGDRLSGHHFVVLLPLAYLALAAGLIAVSRDGGAARFAGPQPALILLTLIAINLAGLHATGTQLLHTHGRGLFSDAIDRFARDARRLPDRDRRYFVLPDWGLFLPFHFLTGARIAHSTNLDLPSMRENLCRGNSVTVALIDGDVSARLRDLTDKLHAAPPAVQAYADHEGKTVFTAATFGRYASGAIREETCAAATPPVPDRP